MVDISVYRKHGIIAVLPTVAGKLKHLVAPPNQFWLFADTIIPEIGQHLCGRTDDGEAFIQMLRRNGLMVREVPPAETPPELPFTNLAARYDYNVAAAVSKERDRCRNPAPTEAAIQLLLTATEVRATAS